MSNHATRTNNFNWDFFPHGGENYRNPNRVGKRP